MDEAKCDDLNVNGASIDSNTYKIPSFDKHGRAGGWARIRRPHGPCCYPCLDWPRRYGRTGSWGPRPTRRRGGGVLCKLG